MVDISIVALVPARSGSKRILHKNTRLLAGVPLLVWTIRAALKAGIFDVVAVSTDDETTGQLALDNGAAFIHCPLDVAHKDGDPDILWVKHALEIVRCDAFALLRPTSPFRTAETIKRAWGQFLAGQPCDSLRAVEPVRQHPGKMWVMRGGRLLPLLPWESERAPWHSSGTQTLPQVWTQNASMEIAWSRTVTEQGTIAGTAVLPFLTKGHEGLNIDTPDDWLRAEQIAAEQEVWL